MNVFEKADSIIQEAYPDSDHKGPGWWGAVRIPNYGILRGAIARRLLELEVEKAEFEEKE